MNCGQQVTYKNGIFYIVDANGFCSQIPFPVIGGGGRGRRGRDGTSFVSAHAYLYWNGADFNAPPDTSLPYTAIINNTNILLDADNKTIIIGLDGKYKVDFIVKGLSSVKDEQQEFAIYVNNIIVPETTFAEEYTGLLVNTNGISILNLKVGDRVTLRNINAVHIGDNNVTIAITLNKVGD